MRSWLHTVRRDVWALDLTSDLGIPCVAAISARSPSGDGVALGFGAALSRAAATFRAFNEVFQMLAMFDEAARGRMRLPLAARRWLNVVRVRDHPFLAPLATTADAGRSRNVGSPSSNFRWLCRRLREHGVDVYLLDQTRSGQYGHTVRVVAPGLRFWWPAFAPGRLFEAPVRAGWKRRPTPRTTLNPRVPWF
jgi:ribosomal protein S12 methylthiotransferase accessory factor